MTHHSSRIFSYNSHQSDDTFPFNYNTHKKYHRDCREHMNYIHTHDETYHVTSDSSSKHYRVSHKKSSNKSDKSDKSNLYPKHKKSYDHNHSKHKNLDTKSNLSPIVDNPVLYYKFNPVSMILSTLDNYLINKNNNYEIRFSTGMLEGTGISINESGNILLFQEEGSYRFEISAEAVLFSDVNATLVYHSDDFSSDIIPFATSSIPKDVNNKLQLRGLPTILPLGKNQTITVKIVPDPDESIVLMSGAKLLIHKVA